MDWTSVKKAIGAFAPWIAGTLGTPVAGAAVGALCNVFGLSGERWRRLVGQYFPFLKWKSCS